MIEFESEVWRAGLSIAEDWKDEGTLACLSILSPDERERADRFLRTVDRDRFVVSHAAWRLVLGRTLHVDPKDLRFDTGPAGKPELAGPERGRLHVNLSHSGDEALIGLSTAGRIGVDVELLRPIPDALRIARHHFAAEEVRDLERRDPDALPAAFIGLWTRKEAFAKASGLGLSLPLDSFVVTVPPHRAEVLSIAGDEAAAHEWSLHGFAPSPGYVGAVAIEGGNRSLSIRSLPPTWPEALSRAS